MPYHKSRYLRKSTRGAWLPDKMIEAIHHKVKSRSMSLREASICFNVPRSTLGRRVLERNKVVSGGMKHQTKQSNREDTALRNIHFLIIELRET